jgi:hypothetical protein
VQLKPTIAALLTVVLLSGCSRQPSEEPVAHPSSLGEKIWTRSDYDIVAREVREFNDHSGNYVVVTPNRADWIGCSAPQTAIPVFNRSAMLAAQDLARAAALLLLEGVWPALSSASDPSRQSYQRQFLATTSRDVT